MYLRATSFIWQDCLSVAPSHSYSYRRHGSVSVRHHGSISFAGSLPLPILAHHSQMSTRRTCSTSTRRASSVATLHRYGAGAATVPQSRTGAARAAAILLLSYCDYATAASDAGSELGTDTQCCHVVCVVSRLGEMYALLATPLFLEGGGFVRWLRLYIDVLL